MNSRFQIILKFFHYLWFAFAFTCFRDVGIGQLVGRFVEQLGQLLGAFLELVLELSAFLLFLRLLFEQLSLLFLG